MEEIEGEEEKKNLKVKAICHQRSWRSNNRKKYIYSSIHQFFYLFSTDLKFPAVHAA